MRAGAQPGEAVRSIVARGEAAERALDFTAAESAYREAVVAGEGSRLGRRAGSRLRYLEARRDPDGGFASLVLLEQLRRSPARPDALSRFEREVDQMTNETARREALLVLGEAWARRLGDPARGVPFYERIAQDGSASASERRMATVALAEARAELGDAERALDELEAAGLSQTFEANEIATVRARRARRLPIAFVLALAVVVLAAVGRPWRAGREGVLRAMGPGRVAGAAWVLGVPALLAAMHTAGAWETFALFALFALPLLALASIGRESLTLREAGAPARASVAVSFAVAALAGAYLALDQGGGLASFGL